jgi:membrane protein YqaA with SNARE-associated domain
MAAVPRQVRKFIDRASLIAAVLIGLLVLWAAGLPLLPVVVFLIAGAFGYGALQHLASRLIGKKSRRRSSRR